MNRFDHVFTDLPNSFLTGVDQVCIVTRDLKSTAKRMAQQLGIGPWWIRTFEPPLLRETYLRGKPVRCAMKIGLAWTGPMNWELVEPVEGPTIYDEFLKSQGEGLHHLAFLRKRLGMSWEACHAEFAARGFSRLFEGKWDEVSFCYYDTLDATHTTLEVIDRPEGWERPDPDEWLPARG